MEVAPGPFWPFISQPQLQAAVMTQQMAVHSAACGRGLGAVRGGSSWVEQEAGRARGSRRVIGCAHHLLGSLYRSRWWGRRPATSRCGWARATCNVAA